MSVGSITRSWSRPPRIPPSSQAPNPVSHGSVSNIHGAGLSYDEAAFKIAWLVREGSARGITGVALKDESGTALIAARPID